MVGDVQQAIWLLLNGTTANPSAAALAMQSAAQTFGTNFAPGQGQVVAVTLLPAALVFLIILLNNEEIMGKYKNSLFENIANITIVVLIIILSTLYGLSTVFPNLFG